MTEILAFLLALVGLSPGAEAAGCIPNPNNDAPPFRNGCPITAAGLNNIGGGSKLSYAGLKYGADTTGAADATTKLNACLAGVGAGNTCLIDPGAKLKILGTVTIPAHTTLKCGDDLPSSDDAPAGWASMPALRVAATGSIVAGGQNASILGCLIYPGFALPQTVSSGWTGTAVSSAGNWDFHIKNSVVFGYDTCIDGYGTPRIIIDTVLADCEGVTLGAVRLGNNGDSGSVRHLKIQPLAMNNGDCIASRRAGNGLHLQNDGAEFLDQIVVQNFLGAQFWFDHALVMAGRLWADTLGLLNNGCSDSSSIGIKISGNSNDISIAHLDVNGTNTGLLIDGVAPPAHIYIASLFVNSISGDCVALGGVETHGGQVTIGAMSTNANAAVNCSRYAVNYRDTTAGSGLRVYKAYLANVNAGAAPYIYFSSETAAGAGGQVQIDSLATDLASGINPYGGTLPVARSIPSAATLLLPPNGCNGRTVATVSGTTNITDIAGMCPNEELTLIFDGVLTVTHGNHILLAGGASFTTATHSLLRMFCFPILGTMYCKEVARAL